VSTSDEQPQPRQFTTDDGSTYQGVPAAEFPDYSDVDHVDGDAEVDAAAVPGNEDQ
jgi:hypothetical protein